MKIALFTDTFLPEVNGVAASTGNLAAVLRENGHEVLVVATNPFGNEISYQDGVLRLPGLAVKKVYNYRVAAPINKEAMRIILDFSPDIVHAQTDAGVGIIGQSAASRLGVPFIYTYHTMIEDYAYYVTKGHFDRFARHVVRFFFRSKSKMTDVIISPSNKSKDYLRSIGIDCPIEVIPTGIDLSRFAPANRDMDEVARLKLQYGLDKDTKVILSLGRIAEEKSIDVLLKGYAKYLAASPKEKTRFLIVGWGPAEDSLKELSGKLGISDHVTFTGKVDPSLTQNYYHLGDIFASASLSETQGLTFMEAMASSLLVLARYDDNLAGTIIDGETGKFFFDEDDFAPKLSEMLNYSPERKRRMISSASLGLEPYSMAAFYSRIIEVYNRVRKKYW